MGYLEIEKWATMEYYNIKYRYDKDFYFIWLPKLNYSNDQRKTHH